MGTLQDKSGIQIPTVALFTFVLFCPDQWSPSNTEGKKQYDRSFLLQLQTVPLSMEKPANLPQMDIIRDKLVQVSSIVFIGLRGHT